VIAEKEVWSWCIVYGEGTREDVRSRFELRFHCKKGKCRFYCRVELRKKEVEDLRKSEKLEQIRVRFVGGL
jgi:hypothetical protein